jgi:ERCC4-related helicase
MTTKLSTRQFIDDTMLLKLVSGSRAKRSRVFERLMETRNPDEDEDTKSYQIDIKINGIEVDFEDFTSEVNRQLDEMVMRAARSIIENSIQERVRAVSAAMYDIERHAKNLAIALENQARTAWGMPPRMEDE